jgi:heat shock protein HtpX
MYEQIARNKRDSWALILILVLILGALGYVIGRATMGTSSAGFGLLAVFGIATIVWSIVGYYAGPGIVLGVTGARQVTHDQAPVLYNVVEEMSIAAGVPVPKVYVIDDPAPNAFATGRDPQHAAVAATTGLLEMMDRDELQGVLAHELSHVRNYDIRFATLVGILVGMIALVCDFFLRFSFWSGGGRRSSSDSGNAGAIFMLIGLVFAILAPLAAMLVQFAISRHREYLADASGVQLTRNPAGLADALEKIAGDPRPLRHANRATAHLYIANPLKGRKDRDSEGLFDTHPPIRKRIEILRAMEQGSGSAGTAAAMMPPAAPPSGTTPPATGTSPAS